MLEDAVIFLDKPSGVSSRKAAYDLLRALGLPKKARWGFVGTLDPMASGLLPIAVGSGTKAITYLEDIFAIKTYRARFLLGQSRRGDDATGEITSPTHVRPSLRRLRTIQKSLQDLTPFFQTLSMQRPPDVSAKHVNGKRAYQLEKAGKPVCIPACSVKIHESEFLGSAIQEADRTLTCDWLIRISRGGYIRSLARDLGTDTGIGGHLQTIERTAMGSFERASLHWQTCDNLRMCTPPTCKHALVIPAEAGIHTDNAVRVDPAGACPRGGGGGDDRGINSQAISGAVVSLRYAIVPFSEIFSQISSSDLSPHAQGILTGQRQIVSLSTPPKTTRHSVAYAHLKWHEQSYTLYLKPLPSMPGNTYQILKRAQHGL